MSIWPDVERRLVAERAEDHWLSLDPALSETVEVPLSRGLVTVIDVEDWPLVADLTWYAHEPRPGQAYAAHRSSKPRSIVRMHRLLMGVTDPAVLVDHRDGNRLNNRRANLRVATVGQNNANRSGPPSASGFRGVYRKGDRWQAQLRVDGKMRSLGCFNDPAEAARAWDLAAAEVHGEYARLNFPVALAQLS